MKRNGTGEDGATRQVRVAAVGDLHFDGTDNGPVREALAEARREADVLVLCGDMTTHGALAQIRGFVAELAAVTVPIVAVLGNHDHESGHASDVASLLREAGVRLLDGESIVIDGIGFAGTKGFGGGFGRGLLGAFGEPETKAFVQAGVDETLKLERALASLDCETRVVVLHYAPIPDTLDGEPEVIWPFLGTSRLMQAIDTFGADVVFHGHAHIGSERGTTAAGIPVYNVALPVLRKNGRNVRIWSASAPDRRAARTSRRTGEAAQA
jgi:uncharacterized protein